MGILPSDYNRRNTTTTSITKTTSTPPLLKEYAVDFDKSEIIIDSSGKFSIVTGLEAVKVRCWLALKIQINRYVIYPTGIGNNLKSLVGKSIEYVNKNIQSILNEALVDGMYVTSIQNITVTQSNDSGTIEFTVNSIYGSYKDSTSY